MKTLQYILGIIVFSCFATTLVGQTINSITADPTCVGNSITIIGKDIAGADAASTVLELDGVDINSNITYVGDNSGSTKDTIIATLPLNQTGVLAIRVEKHGADATKDETADVTILDPDVTISVTDNSVCYNTAPVLKFDVSGTFMNTSTITYTVNGVSNTIISSDDGEVTVPVGAITSTTNYQIVSIASAGGCTTTISGESETVTVAPDIIGSMSLSSNRFCPSASTLTLTFNISNPNGDNMEIFYKEGSVESSVTTTSTTASVTLTPTITNTYQLTRIKNTTEDCEKFINGTSETVTRIAPIVATFSAADNIICAGSATDLTFAVANPDGYSLEVFYTAGGVQTSFITSGTSETVSITPNVSTTYTITKINNISLSCENTITNASLSVSVIPFPTLSFNNTGTAQICNGESTTLKFNIGNKSSANVPIEVEYLAGAVTKTMVVYGADTTLTVSPTSTTTYTLSNVKDVSSSCEQTASGTETVTVNPEITGILTATTTTVCFGSSVDLVFNINNPNGNAMQVFYEENGTEKSFNTSGTVQVLNESPNTTTTYQLVRIENTTTGCQKTIGGTPIAINIRTIPTATLTITGSPAICLGESTTLKFDISNKTNVTDLVDVSYSAGGTLKTITVFGIDTTITVSPMVTTSYTLTTVEDVFLGCSSSPTSSKEIIVYPANTGSLTVSDNTICNGESVSLFFGANNTVGDNLTFYYSDGSSTFTALTTGNLAAISLTNLSTTTTFRLDSIENITRGCVTKISSNNVETIIVNNTMGATIAVDPISICEGEVYSVDFGITGRVSGDNVTIQYTKSNGTNINTLLSTSTAVSDNISVTGTESITTLYSLVSITNSTTGCETTYNPSTANSAQVLITPAINYSIGTATPIICEGTNTNLIFSVDNQNGQPITIFYSDGTNTDSITTATTTASITISPTISTTYTATKVKTATCEYSLPGKFVDITVNKVPDVSISGGGIACNGQTIPIQFSITNKNNLSDSITIQFLNSGALQPIKTNSSAATYIVSPPTTTVYPLVSVTNTTVGCTNNNVNGSVTVTVGSGLSGDVQVSENEICLGESVNLSLVVNGLSGPTEVVYTDGMVNDTIVATSSTTTLIKSPMLQTTYSLVSLGDTSTGCPGSSGTSPQQIVVVNALPTSILTGDGTICFGDAATLAFNFNENNSHPPYNVNYKERKTTGGVTNLGLFAAGDTTINIFSVSDAEYTITNISDGKGCTALPITDTVDIFVDPLPTASFTLDNYTMCRGSNNNINFEVQNNEGLDVYVRFEIMKADINSSTGFTTVAVDSILTNNVFSLPISPDSTTTYKITGITNAVTGCYNAPSNANVPQTLTIYQLPEIAMTVDSEADTVCNGGNAVIEFDFPTGIAPFNVYFEDIFSTSTTRIDTGQVWTSLASGINVMEQQENLGTFQLDHTYYVTKVVDGFGCVHDYNFPLEPSVVVKIDATPRAILSGDATICKNDFTDLTFDFADATVNYEAHPPYTVNYEENRINSGGGIVNLGLSATADTSISISPLGDAKYRITNIIDAKGCVALALTDTVEILVDPLPTASFSLDTNFMCRGLVNQLTFTVENNEGLDVYVQYKSITNGNVVIDSALTNNVLSIPISPNFTTTYQITGIRNAVTNCYSAPSNGNLPQTLTVYQLPEIIPTVDIETDTVCNGNDTRIEFDFPVGVAPFTVYFADSFATSTMRIDTGQVWTSLASGANVIEEQENNEVYQLSHTYFVTKVIDGFGCINNFVFPQEPSTTIKIDPTPDVSLTGVQPTSQPYASTDLTPYQIQGTPQGGPLYSTFSGAGIGLTQYPAGQTYASNNFIAANAGFQPSDSIIDIFLTYTYEDAFTGCSNEAVDTARIKKALTFDFYNEGTTAFQDVYCRNADSTYVYAKITTVDTVNVLATNTFVLDNVSSIVFSDVQSFGDSVRVKLKPLNATGVFPIKFGSVADGFVTIQVTVIDTVNTTFSPNIDSSYFCQVNDSINLTGIPNVLASDTAGVFTSLTLGIIDREMNGSPSDSWFLRKSIAGWHEVTYTYTDIATGCVTTKVQNVEISPAPVAHYQIDIECNTKTTTFVDNSTFTESVVGLDSLINWNLTFGDGRDTTFDVTFNHTHKYLASSVYTAALNIESARGCLSDWDTTFIIGNIPNVDFDWLFATQGDDTRFVSTTPDIADPAIGAGDFIDSLIWHFGAGLTSIEGSFTDVDTVTYEYPGIGLYTPVLYASTNNGCLDSIKTNVYILPKIGIGTYPYYQRFNDNNFPGGGWVADPNISGNYWTWEKPEGVHIKHNNDPTNKVWITNLDSIYQNGKDAWVYSPTFNFTTLEQPMVAFRYWADSRVSDGAVLQYTDDSGLSWNVLGKPETGLSWYDVSNLVAQPGEQSGFDGYAWTGNDTLGGWQVARHKLDDLKGKPKVRFRVSFAIVPGAMTNYDGFAFDDFWVGERQKRVLVESFTHVNNTLYNQVQDSIYKRMDDNNLDMVLVEYHNNIPNTGIPSNDNFNQFNPADPSARSLYYQYSETGKMAIDGEVRETASGLDLNWTQNDMDLVILEEPIFNVAIDQFTITGNTIDVSTTIKARKPMPANLRKVYIAVVEDDLAHSGTSVIHKSVLRKLLPSAAGTSLTTAWAIGTSESISSSWTLTPGAGNPPINTANLKVVVWIQSNQTQKVYQVASSALSNVVFDSTVVNTEEPLDNTEDAFSLFPNPNNGNFTVQFEAPTRIEAQWQLVDISGRILKQGNIPSNTEAVFIQTEGIAQGMYFFRMVNADGVGVVRKVLVE